MSRVDQALRRLEGARGVDPAEAATARIGKLGLNQYGREALHESEPLPSPQPPEIAPENERVRREAPVGSSLQRIERDLEARLVSGNVGAVAVEQYRRLAAVLHETQMTRGLKSVMITSALPDEGKTLTAVNLALTLTDSFARRVLLVDADLRWPSLHRYLGIGNQQGLSEALRDEKHELPLFEISDRLTVLTAGQPGPTPLVGLSSQRMASLLEECTRRFDWVLLDTPPVGLLTDAQLLARLTGGVIVVIGAGAAPAAAVERAVADLGPECIIGTVLNRVESHRISEAGYYKKYASNGDGKHRG